jgi:hypothetical protein
MLEQLKETNNPKLKQMLNTPSTRKVFPWSSVRSKATPREALCLTKEDARLSRGRRHKLHLVLPVFIINATAYLSIWL